MRKIKQLSAELEDIINSISKCNTSKNVGGFTINARKGVVWGETRRSKKWGQAFDEGERFSVAIDFPLNSYRKEQLSDFLGLQERYEGEKRSGFRTRTCEKYDTVQISIYEDRLDTYSFKNGKFQEFIYDVVERTSNN